MVEFIPNQETGEKQKERKKGYYGRFYSSSETRRRGGVTCTEDLRELR